MRAAAAAALAEPPADQESLTALAHALHRDPSYAVRAAAAVSIGKSGRAEAFDLLYAELAGKVELHVASALHEALAHTGDSRVAELLLADTRPGVPMRRRLSACTGLP